MPLDKNDLGEEDNSDSGSEDTIVASASDLYATKALQIEVSKKRFLYTNEWLAYLAH